MPTFLHVGCGMQHKETTTEAFNTPAWTEVRLDIDPTVEPDILGTMTDMSGVASASVDAVFSSHNIEHLYPHEVPLALAEFRRILKPEGFVVITCPDLQSVAALVADDRLLEPAYQSEAGPISPLDMIYGLRAAMRQGNLYMAHRCGFTRRALAGALARAGFEGLASIQRPAFFDLWAVGVVTDASSARALALAEQHFPARRRSPNQP